jgi:hypothetical protein
LNSRHFGSFTFIFTSFGESCLLVSWCAGGRCGMAWHAAMRIVAGVGDLLQMIENGHTGRILGGRVIEKSDDAICGMHRACGDEECIFLG